jgi:hypothetical protein
VPLTIGGVAMRERTKLLLVRWCHDLRLSARCLAKALVAEQKLPDPHLVFHLSLYEVRSVGPYSSQAGAVKLSSRGNCRREKIVMQDVELAIVKATRA